MAQDTIKCPNCGTEIKLTQAFYQQIESEIKKTYEKKEEKLLHDYEAKETELRNKLLQERKDIEEKAKKEVAEKNRLEIIDLKEQLNEKSKQLQQAEQLELGLRKRQRDLEEREKSLELNLARKLDEEREKIREKVVTELEENHRLKDAEKEKQLAEMRQQIIDLKKKAEEGSQKRQGEVLELELEQMLRDEFPFDDIASISSGTKGADIVHTVKTQTGRVCGKILWETKRTKTWSNLWLQKLREDRQKEKADQAVVVSETLPEGFHHFRQIEDIWVTDIPSALSLAIALRAVLIQVALTRQIQTGKEEKMELVYNYLTGTEFRNRVRAIMEAFIIMKKDLDTEKRAIEGQWARREKQIEKVVLNIAGMRGDLEGIAGESLPSIKLLELPSEPEGNHDTKDEIPF